MSLPVADDERYDRRAAAAVEAAELRIHSTVQGVVCLGHHTLQLGLKVVSPVHSSTRDNGTSGQYAACDRETDTEVSRFKKRQPS